MIEQKSIQRLVKNTDYVDFDDIRILQTGTLAFDASTFEIWGALLNGGSVHIADEGTLSEPWRLKEEISRRRVNTMFITTALFNQMLNLDIEVFDGLTQLLFGGEATSEGQVKMLRSHNGKLQISNVYWPTETTTFATHYPIVVEKREDSNRKTDSEYNSICYEGRETVRDRHAGRIMYRRGRRSQGIPEQTGTDKGTIHREPICAGRTDIPNRRPGALAAGWQPGVSGPNR